MARTDKMSWTWCKYDRDLQIDYQKFLLATRLLTQFFFAQCRMLILIYNITNFIFFSIDYFICTKKVYLTYVKYSMFVYFTNDVQFLKNLFSSFNSFNTLWITKSRKLRCCGNHCIPGTLGHTTAGFIFNACWPLSQIIKLLQGPAHDGNKTLCLCFLT